jgi:hypothetical protein
MKTFGNTTELDSSIRLGRLVQNCKDWAIAMLPELLWTQRNEV